MNEINKAGPVPVKNWMKRHPVWSVVIGFMALSFILSVIGSNAKPTIQANTPAPQEIQTVATPIPPVTEKQTAPTPQKIEAITTPDPSVSAQSKIDAQKELDRLITLSKTAGLVTSYEFSDKASVVYVSNVWYTQPVTFKKDFMAKIAMLKKTITGYAHFEVRDTNSNEKVGEVTAFSSSLEVYK